VFSPGPGPHVQRREPCGRGEGLESPLPLSVARRAAAFLRKRSLSGLCLYMEALSAYIAYWAALGFLSRPLVARLVADAREEAPGISGAGALRVASRLSLRIDGVVSLFPGRESSCLRKALALRSLLSRRGIASRLVLGVYRPDTRGAVLAHAWLDVGDGSIGSGPASIWRKLEQAASEA
jgi:hypothetical protein